MDVEIIDQRQNPLLNRKEIKFKILHPKEPTPNRDSARDKIASMSNAKKEQVIIDSLDTTFGKSETTGYAKVYPSKEEAMKNERKYELIRNRQVDGGKKDKKPAAPAPAPAPAAEGEEEAAPAAEEEKPAKEAAPEGEEKGGSE